MSPLINKIFSTDQQSVEQSLKAGKGIYTFLNPVSYLAAVEGEVTALRMILTGLLAGLPAETIRERLRDLYA